MERRSQICINFVKKALKHPNYSENEVDRDRVTQKLNQINWNQYQTEQIVKETHHYHTVQIFSTLSEIKWPYELSKL